MSADRLASSRISERKGIGVSAQAIAADAATPTAPPTEVVTARAVAALDQLITWCWPLVRKGGQLIALKGERAQQEVEEAGATLRKLRLTATIQAVENTAAVIVSAAE